MLSSKEAITKLNVLSSYETSEEKRKEYKECINTILKDLEVLDLIHDHPIEFSWVAKSKNYTDYIFIGGTTLPFRFSEEEFNKVKEWLKNDK